MGCPASQNPWESTNIVDLSKLWTACWTSCKVKGCNPAPWFSCGLDLCVETHPPCPRLMRRRYFPTGLWGRVVAVVIGRGSLDLVSWKLCNLFWPSPLLFLCSLKPPYFPFSCNMLKGLSRTKRPPTRFWNPSCVTLQPWLHVKHSTKYHRWERDNTRRLTFLRNLVRQVNEVLLFQFEKRYGLCAHVKSPKGNCFPPTCHEAWAEQEPPSIRCWFKTHLTASSIVINLRGRS